jgi:putative sigma-54 modulation protein
MNINIKTTNISLTPAISDYTNKRINKIAQLLDTDPSSQCDVELGKTTGHHNKGQIFRAEIHIVGAGKNLYATSEKEDLYAAIDIVRDDILRELKSNKEKRTSFVRRGGARMKAMIKGFWPWGTKGV